MTLKANPAAMLKTREICARLIAMVFVASAAAMIVSGQRRGTSVVLEDGEFQAIDDVPTAFAPFVTFSLSRIVVSRRGRVRARRLDGVLDAGRVNGYVIARPLLTGRELSFKTRAKNGVTYQFTGRFPKDFSVDEHGSPDGEMLRGTLVKFVRGAEAARADISFRFQYYSD